MEAQQLTLSENWVKKKNPKHIKSFLELNENDTMETVWGSKFIALSPTLRKLKRSLISNLKVLLKAPD